MPHMLKYVGFMDPLWFNTVKNAMHMAKVISSSEVELDGQTLRATQPETCNLQTGDHVYVWFDQNFYFKTVKEHQESIEQTRRLKQREKEKRIKEHIHQKQNAISFYAQYNIPCLFKAEIKHVLSGLTEQSTGNGVKKNTVYHFMFLENWKSEKLIRSFGDFLCTSPKGDNGHFHELRSQTISQNPTPSIVTCKKCLKLMERWKTKS